MDDELYKDKSKTIFHELMDERKKSKKSFFGENLHPVQEQDTSETEEITTPVLSYGDFADRIENGNYDRSVFLRWKRNQSESMKPIVSGARDLANMLQAQASPEGIQVMLDIYKGLKAACIAYLKSHDPKSSEGKARYELVRKISERVTGEMSEATINAEIYSKSKDDTPQTWAEVLIGVHSIELKKEQVKVPNGVVAQSSKLLKIKDGGKKYFFKYKEKAPEFDTESMLREVTADYKQRLDMLLNKQGPFAGLSAEKTKIEAKKIMDVIQVIAVLRDSLVKYGIDNFDSRNEEGTLEELEACGANVEGINEDAYKEFYAAYSKKYTLAAACKVAGIKVGSDVTKRNEATSVLADFLGISDMMMKSSTVKLDVEGEKIDGLRMDKALGIEGADVNKKETASGKTVHLTPEAIKQLFILQVFDILCGQIDRHQGNYLARCKTKGDELLIEGVTGIDNDLSFGTLSYQDIVMKKKQIHVANKMESLEVYNEKTKKIESVAPAIDADFANKILALKPEMIDLLLGRLLDKDELSACKDRLKGLQQYMVKEKALDESRKAGDKRFMASLEEWKAFRDAVEKAPYTAAQPNSPNGERVLTQRDLDYHSLVKFGYMGEKVY